MIKLIHILAAPIAAAAMLAAPTMASEEAITPTKGEAKLAKLLEGRTPGDPTSCVRTFPSENMQVIDGTAIVVGRGRTIYVNVPRDPGSLDDDDILVIRKHSGSQLCRLDWIEARDRLGQFYRGNIMLNDFVPYTRVETGSGEG